jgi:hypothetical protein
MRKSFIISSLTAVAALCLCVTAQAQGPVVVSDKDDYAPGEIALFTAAGFEPFELLDFSIAISDENGEWIPDIAWADVPADASGGAEVDYVVPETWADKTLQLTVMGLTSGLMATTTFTDHTPHRVWNVNFATSGLVPPTSITISGSRNTPGGTHSQAVFSKTFTSPGPSTNEGSAASLCSGAFTGMWTYSGFPASVPGVGGTYDLVSVTDPDGTFPCSGGSCFPKSFTTPCTTLTGGGVAGTSTVTATYVFTPTPPANIDPEITCLDNDADLGQVVGCLGVGTGFGQTFPVSWAIVSGTGNSKIVQATFTRPDSSTVTIDVANVTDADSGDTITVNLSNETTSVTISGPGSGSASFSVDIDADDGNGGADSDTCGGNANAQIVYNFSGFFPPLSGQINCKVKQGSGIPVKFAVTDCSGNPITTGNHTIDVVYVSGIVPSGDPTVDDAGMSGDNGINFRYDPTGMQWIFNLKTNSSYAVGNTYKIIATLDDETTHEAYIAIKR